jgi:hypothetical protein
LHCERRHNEAKPYLKSGGKVKHRFRAALEPASILPKSSRVTWAFAIRQRFAPVDNFFGFVIERFR